MNAVIQAIDYYLPERVLDNAALAAEFPDWPAEKIRAKTGNYCFANGHGLPG